MLSTNEYLAINVPDQAYMVLAKYGYTPVSDSIQDVTIALDALVREQGEPALKDLMSIHPDKDFILNYAQEPATPAATIPSPSASTGMMPSRNGGFGTDYLADIRNSGENMFGHVKVDKTWVLVGAIVLAAVLINKKA